MSNAELEKSIRELNEKVKVLMAERDARRDADMLSDISADPPKPYGGNRTD